jgi:hypothetical protein
LLDVQPDRHQRGVFRGAEREEGFDRGKPLIRRRGAQVLGVEQPESEPAEGGVVDGLEADRGQLEVAGLAQIGQQCV